MMRLTVYGFEICNGDVSRIYRIDIDEPEPEEAVVETLVGHDTGRQIRAHRTNYTRTTIYNKAYITKMHAC